MIHCAIRRLSALLATSVVALTVAHVASAQAEPTPVGVPGTWVLKLNEDFTSSGVNTALWTPGWQHSGISGPMSGQCLSSGNVSQPGNGYLYLQVKAQKNTCGTTSVEDTGGLVESNPDDGVSGHTGFSYSYGYVEWRAYVPGVEPKGLGCPKGGCLPDWPALWSLSSTSANEIDTMEGLGSLGQACYHVHPPPGSEGPGGCLSGSYAGWHTYGTEWEPGVAKYFYDGSEVGEVKSGEVTATPQYLIADMVPPGCCGGPLVIPDEMAIDYVRVWQHPSPPTVRTQPPASPVQQEQATPAGTVNPNGVETHYYFQYGLSTEYGSETSPVGAGSGTSELTESTTITNLQPGRTYHYRIVAYNSGGTSYGSDQAVTTPQAARPVLAPSGSSWTGIIWRGTDGNIYETDAPKGEWESYSPTWTKKGIPSGVTAASDPVIAPSGTGWSGIIWRGTDGNIYETDAPNGEWESYSPTWTKKGIPSGVTAVGDPVIAPSGSGWNGIIWRGTDGNIYETDAPNGEWETFSPTWSKKGLPSGVTAVSNPVMVPSASGWSGILWLGSDGNIYETDAPNGEWESYSPTWTKKGIPSGVTAVGDPVIAPSGSGWNGIIWRGTDGNIYETDAPNGEWESYSPTWTKAGIPSGVFSDGDPVIARVGTGYNGIMWRGSDGNVYDTDAPRGEWESFSPSWSKKGLPSGVSLGGDPVMALAPAGWNGIIWRGTDGNIYETDAPNEKEWESYSPTWTKKGLPSGVTMAVNTGTG